MGFQYTSGLAARRGFEPLYPNEKLGVLYVHKVSVSLLRVH